MQFLDEKGLELVLRKIKAKIDSTGNKITTSLSKYLTKTEASETYYNKEKSNELYQRKGSYVVPKDLKNYYKKEEVDNLISNIVYSGDLNLSGYYKRTESDDRYLQRTVWEKAFSKFIYQEANQPFTKVDFPGSAEIYFEQPIFGYLSKDDAKNTYMTRSDVFKYYLKKSEKAQSAKVADTITGNEGFLNYLHRHNNTTLPKTNSELNKLGIFVRYFSGDGKIDNQPTTWGQLINLPIGADSEESCQLWLQQSSGSMWHRGGNAETPVNNKPFVKFLDTEDMFDGNTIKLPNGAKIGVE